MQFDGMTLDQLRRQFAQTDQEIIKLSRQELAWQLDQKEIPKGNGQGPVGTFSELGLLRHQMGLQKRHLPIRKLIERAGNAIQSLKPCFMMGPLSVAQYLKPGELKFDLVVMDEASQLKPEDALGSFARGAQVVIVGDRMQLPPTSFFDKMVIDEADDDDSNTTTMDDAKSILEVASSIHQPARILKWHYRSRHESLIAFSNKEFYGNALTVFPSSSERSEELGVKFKHISNGIYQGQQNMVEAQRVVEAVLEHLHQHSNESLGVVSFNLKQADLIESLLSQYLKKDAIASRRMDELGNGANAFFVKNLETVQGDERDVIFISTTYGQDAAGKLSQNFGPINKANGHRRLNVLVTRAKKRVVVFSSMDPDEIREGPTSPAGLRALKGYLSYAKTGVLHQDKIGQREPDSDFEVVVASALQKRGFEVVPQVGVANYWIDMAVRHPKKPGTFILGIECDGATYHSSRSARDRDRIREAVLKGLGWNIHRIWSTDWFRNGEREIDKVIARIKELL
jgi:very-short-patch-repair endonuclease